MTRILFPILILVAAWQLWDHIETRRLETAYATIRPYVLERRPTGNRAPAVQESAGRFYAGAAVTTDWGGGYLPEDSIFALTGRVRTGLVQGDRPSAVEQGRIDRFMKQNDLALALIDRGAGLPFTVFSDYTEPSRYASGVIEAERMAAVATLDAIGRNDATTAVRWTYGRLQLMRAMPVDTFGGSMKSEMLANAATDMAMILPAIDAADLERLRAAWGSATTDEELAHSVAGFAKSRYDFVQQVSGARSWQYGHLGVPLRPLLAHRVALSLETSNEVLEVARRPWPDRIKAMAAVHDQRSIVGNVFMPYQWWEVAESMQLVAKLLARGVAAARVAGVAIAIEDYRRQQHILPASLADLPAVDRAAVTDPFTGQPLHYRPEGGGFVVYSVGENGTDDRGAIEVRLQKGAMPGRGVAPDIGIRVRLQTDTAISPSSRPR